VPNPCRLVTGPAFSDAFLVPILLVISHPVRLCSAGRTVQRSCPSCVCRMCRGTKRLVFPLPARTYVVDAGSKSNNFNVLRAHRFHFSKSTSHQNLPPTSQGLEPHIYRAFYNSYTTMHVLDGQLGVGTGLLDPVDYGFTLENGHLSPSTSWKTMEARWSGVCHCGKCARVTCPCRAAQVKCSLFCKCKKTENCKNPYN
jgi:hypothetical protein